MKFGNAAWGFRETPLWEQFEITKEMGLDAIEIGIANAPGDIPLDAPDALLASIRTSSEEYGVKMASAATGNDFTVGTDDVEKVKTVIDICQKLGIGYLRIFAGFTAIGDVTDEMFENMCKSLSVVCDYAKEKGVVPVIETHGGVNGYDDGVEHFASTTTNLASIKKIMSSLPENARICFDPANLFAVGENPVEIYKKIKDKVAYAHFKDFKKVSENRIKPSFCGDSDMDWDAILKEMEFFGGYAFFEYENTEDIKDGLIKCRDYINERIEKL